MCQLTPFSKKEVFFIACLHPLVAMRKLDGSIKVFGKFVPQDAISYTLNYATGEVENILKIPCGKCINCKMAYAKTWSVRSLLEAKMHDENWFITLTYDDYFVPWNGDVQTLEPVDFTLFMKRLRKHFGEGVRFYMCGEYGGKTLRPHYHMLAFNLSLLDLKFYSKSPMGDWYYTSDVLNKIWGKGQVIVGELAEQSASYTARYVQKKAYKNFNFEQQGMKNEFTRMSRNPGIGGMYLDEYLDKIYDEDKIYMPNGQVVTPPRYFDKIAEQKGVDIEWIRAKRRQVAELATQYLTSLMPTTDEYVRYQNMLEESLLNRRKSLIRRL